MFYLSLLLYLVSTAFLTLRVFKQIRLSHFTSLLFILITSVNVLVAQLLHFLSALNNPVLFLLTQFILCALLILILVDPLHKIFSSPFPKFSVAFDKPTFLEGFLTLLILAVLGLAFYIGTLSPINNSDSLHTHLPRIFYWLQHGSLSSWYPTAMTQISYPINISVQGLWLFLFTGSEMSFFLAPWLALAAIAAQIFDIATLLGAEKHAALTAALLGLSFPVVLLQTYSYQGDAFVAALILCSIFFLLRFYQHKHKADLFLSILVLALSLGSKQTALLVLPTYLLALLLMLRNTLSLRTLLIAALFGLITFMLFSSFKFIQNRTEKELEEVHMVNPWFVDHLFGVFQNPFEGYLINGLRYLYQAISLDGFQGELKLNLETQKEEGFRRLSDRLGIDLESRVYLPEYEEGYFEYDFDWPVNEEGSWFGPVSWTLLPLAMLLTLFQKRYPLRKWYLLFTFLLLLTYIFGQVILKGDGWGAFRGRHMTIGVVALAPLFISLIPSKPFYGKTISIILALTAFYLSISVLLINNNRPMITSRTLYQYEERVVYAKPITNPFQARFVSFSDKLIKSLLLTTPDRRSIREESYYGRLFFQNASAIEMINFANRNIHPSETLYIMIQPSFFEYALFGQNRTREVIPLESLRSLPDSACALVSNSLLEGSAVPFRRIETNQLYTILCNR